jgi:hypothetical protein
VSASHGQPWAAAMLPGLRKPWRGSPPNGGSGGPHGRPRP